jgi:actin cytoskeleton-regulatory complex protein PAN1
MRRTCLTPYSFSAKRLKEDLDRIDRRRDGGRAKEEERRKLERELWTLLHEKVPEVEQKVKDRYVDHLSLG